MLGTSRILEKGPEYLRKQMELESEAKGRVSAVTRLAATKPQYVKSQHVLNPTHESVGSGAGTEQATAESGISAVKEENVKRNGSKKRPDSLLLYRQRCVRESSGAKNRRNLNKKIFLNSLKDKPLPQACCREAASGQKATEDSAALPETAPQPTPCTGGEGHHQDHQLRARQVTPRRRRNATEMKRASPRGVTRSHSDISSRYSKNFADFDAFFKYCGLAEDVIDCMGKDNFSLYSEELCSKIRSVSVSTSEDGFTRSSGDSDRLRTEEAREKTRQAQSEDP
ncbi:protein FAM110C isoform X1 [Electrophorus electricus]|uniref:protein FAM110C isoform X1 n=1 Tax=Electrophorus electricus TaxID=8005 RepID=UPI0015D01040|nr:protein FAM110C isoform X1 [Electrophorus electricus]XP_035378564.1 protein FAM110C isoform X1 [Electrophorus electricus]